MIRSVLKICLIVMGFLSIPTASFALPNCPSDQTKWYHNCFGTYTWSAPNPNAGEKYVGEWKDNKKHGQGTVTWSAPHLRDGVKHVGEYKNGEMDGQGTVTWSAPHLSAGTSYIGEFKDSKKNGQGFHVWKDGRADLCFYTDNEDSNCSGTNVYDVAPNLTEKFRQMPKSQRKKIQSNLKLNGFYTSVVDGKWGHETFTALASYAALNLKTVNINNASSANTLFQRVLGSSGFITGSCPADQSAYWDNCTGKITFDDGSKYVGEWKDNKQHGQGTYSYANGDKYVGEFKDDNRDGPGTYSYADGTIDEGIWKDGELQNAQTSPEVVETDDPNETREVASGTGFYVSNEGHIITNYHVIDGCMDMKVHTKGRVIPTLRIADDELNDLALLKISEPPSHVFALTNDSPFPLQEIVVAGFPFGESYSSSLKFTQGIISSLTGIGNNYSEIQIDAALQPGNSGGPIIDEYGNIVGVAVAKLDAKYTLDNFGVIPENTNFGIKASAVKNLLEGNQVPLKTPTNELISKRDLSRLATDGTVYLTCWMTSAQLEQMKSKKVMFGNLD